MQEFKERRNYRVTLEKAQLSCVFSGSEGDFVHTRMREGKRLQQPTRELLKETFRWKERNQTQPLEVLPERGCSDPFHRAGAEAGAGRARLGLSQQLRWWPVPGGH